MTMGLAAESQFFYNEYKLYITCLIKYYSLEMIRESRHQMMIHHSINLYQNKKLLCHNKCVI